MGGGIGLCGDVKCNFFLWPKEVRAGHIDIGRYRSISKVITESFKFPIGRPSKAKRVSISVAPQSFNE